MGIDNPDEGVSNQEHEDERLWSAQLSQLLVLTRPVFDQSMADVNQQFGDLAVRSTRESGFIKNLVKERVNSAENKIIEAVESQIETAASRIETVESRIEQVMEVMLDTQRRIESVEGEMSALSQRTDSIQTELVGIRAGIGSILELLLKPSPSRMITPPGEVPLVIGSQPVPVVPEDERGMLCIDLPAKVEGGKCSIEIELFPSTDIFWRTLSRLRETETKWLNVFQLEQLMCLIKSCKG